MKPAWRWCFLTNWRTLCWATTWASKYAFNDRMLFSDESTYQNLGFRHIPEEETAADKKAIELLKNSPYAQKLDNGGPVPESPATLGLRRTWRAADRAPGQQLCPRVPPSRACRQLMALGSSNRLEQAGSDCRAAAGRTRQV